MTSARIVACGQAMAMIPTMTARMPSRINEVEVDLNMKGIPFRLGQSHQANLIPRCLSIPGDATAAAVGQHLPPMDI
jgi:hypothetical protein